MIWKRWPLRRAWLFLRHAPSLQPTIRGLPITLDQKRRSMELAMHSALPNSERDGWFRLVDHFDLSWRETVISLFNHYTERTPGSNIEEKEINVTWHYKDADPEFGSWQAAELQMNLEKVLWKTPSCM